MKISEKTRVATLNDIPELLVLLREFFDMSPFKDFAFSEEKVRILLEYAIIDPKTAIVIVSVDDDGHVQGLIAGRTDTAPFSDAKTALELAWFIRPAFRKGSRAFELFDAFEAWARAVDADYTYYGNLKELPDVNDDLIDRFYKHRGCRPVERGYIKRLK